MILPNNIRYLRKSRGWSQERLAELLGYKSFTTIQKWETGVSEPPLKKAHALADLFGVDIDILTKVDLEHEQIPFSSLNQWNDGETFLKYAISRQNEVSDRIEGRMKELGLSVEKVMEDLGFDDEIMDYYLSGRIVFEPSNSPVADRIDDFAEELKTTSKYLLLRTNDPYDFDRDPEHILFDIPEDAYAELKKQYGDDKERIYREWTNGLRESYRSTFSFSNNAHFATIQDDSEHDKKHLVLIRVSESLHRLEPVANKLETLSPKARNELLKLIKQVVDTFVGQN